MQMRNIHEAKSQLSHLIELVYAGEEIIICKAGKPMVKIIRYQNEEDRKPGAWRGKVYIADNFDETSPEIEKLFEGEGL
jgi:prevent-host-death family protein